METTSGVLSDHTHLLPLLRSFSDQNRDENLAIAGASSCSTARNYNDSNNDQIDVINESEEYDDDYKYQNVRVINETDV